MNKLRNEYNDITKKIISFDKKLDRKIIKLTKDINDIKKMKKQLKVNKYKKVISKPIKDITEKIEDEKFKITINV